VEADAAAKAAVDADAAAAAEAEVEAEAKAAADAAQPSDIQRRFRCVKTAVIRADASLDSPKIGKLKAGYLRKSYCYCEQRHMVY
jgi:hypothetical protein